MEKPTYDPLDIMNKIYNCQTDRQSLPSAMHFLVKIVGFKVLNLLQWSETADSDLEGC